MPGGLRKAQNLDPFALNMPGGLGKVQTLTRLAIGAVRAASLMYVQGLDLYVQEALCTFSIHSARSEVTLYV